jgi:hypothetical protein
MRSRSFNRTSRNHRDERSNDTKSKIYDLAERALEHNLTSSATVSNVRYGSFASGVRPAAAPAMSVMP